MIIALKLKATVAAVALAAPLFISAGPPAEEPTVRPLQAAAPEMVTLAPGKIAYRAGGDFARNGKPANAPQVTLRVERSLSIMKRQVTAAEYQSCVDAGACAALPEASAQGTDRPMVGVSWRDATAYAAWLSQMSGQRFRLPTDEEWAFAAGSRFRDDAFPEFDGTDPSRRWLARYEEESTRERPGSKQPQPVGTFGANEHGLLDLGGNVWEWTNSCFTRGVIEANGEARASLVNCGVRVVEGAHRTYMTDFIRDARAGGCAVGTPPSNLGFRLVREADGPLRRLIDWFGV